jgi:hypothetical protein
MNRFKCGFRNNSQELSRTVLITVSGTVSGTDSLADLRTGFRDMILKRVSKKFVSGTPDLPT